MAAVGPAWVLHLSFWDTFADLAEGSSTKTCHAACSSILSPFDDFGFMTSGQNSDNVKYAM